MTNLESDLKNLAEESGPEAADAALKAIWDNFRGTDAHKALELVLNRMEAVVDSQLCTASLPSGARDFYAGSRAVIQAIRQVVLCSTNLELEQPPDAPIDTGDSTEEPVSDPAENEI